MSNYARVPFRLLGIIKIKQSFEYSLRDFVFIYHNFVINLSNECIFLFIVLNFLHFSEFLTLTLYFCLKMDQCKTILGNQMNH